jgi:hypothetical protein
MTIPDFLLAFRQALPATQAQILLHTPHVYPRGELIRVQVPQAPTELPPMADPLSLVYFHRTGEFKGVLESTKLGIALGLTLSDAIAVALASDTEEPRNAGVQALRLKLITAVESYRHTQR